jgi:oligosaccharide repeat unit polymerase
VEGNDMQKIKNKCFIFWENNNAVIFRILFFVYCGLYGLTIVNFAVHYIISNLEGMMFSVLLLFFLSFLATLMKFKKNIAYILFLTSFFCFLLGRYGVNYMMTGKVDIPFSLATSKHMLLLLFISLLSLQLGFWLFQLKERKKNKQTVLKEIPCKISNETIQWIRNLSVGIFFISALFAIIENIEIFIFIQNHSYVDTFLDFQSSLPDLFRVLGNANLFLFVLFLATCPGKKQCILPIIVFMIITISLLLTGDRGEVILNACVVIVYIFWRQYHDGEVWISNRLIILACCLVPVVMAGMSFFVFLREGIDVGNKDFFSQLARFFRAAGKSVNIIGYGYDNIDSFPQSFYSIGGIIDYIQYNSISEFLFHSIQPKQHTVEYAMNMHSYSHAITYLVDSKSYLSGHGLGSCYIAEAFHDFRYVGVVVINVCYGYFASYVNRMKIKNPFLIAIVLLMIRGLYYTSRGPAAYPITSSLSIVAIMLYIGIFLIARYHTGGIDFLKRHILKR